ncbi:MAG: hypothetical protein FJ077_05355 [Cyanobacteria bacterium K_DeepCast_35m_m2_023]|nr:hypothetical protein [Cyanobacteria bacterium K_DeepCast_35m_m2_023]
MLIIACISAHGYGHGSRTTAVLTALAQLQPQWRLVLSTALPRRFLDLAMGPLGFTHRSCQWDVGVIQADALGSDPAATLRALQDLDHRLPEQIETEACWIEAQRSSPDEPVVVVGDVPPAAAPLARRLGAPLVWLASFGWEAIYGPMGPAFVPWADAARRAYRQGDLLLRCPLSMPIDWGIRVVDVGLTAGTPRLSSADLDALAQQWQLPSDRDRCILISFGGLGLDLADLPLERWPNHVFIGPDPSLARHSNGRCIPDGLRPLDLMPRCGRLITKPGYSSFCEALSQGLGIHLVEREGFAEAAVLQRDLQNHGWHRLLRRDDLSRGDWQLDQPLLPPRLAPLPDGGCGQAAAALVALLQGT